MKWLNEEIDILKKFYPKNGLDYTVDLLPNRTKNSIKYKIYDLKLKVDKLKKGELISKSKLKSVKNYNKFKINPEKFLIINSKEVSYILGLLWADGYIYKDTVSIWMKKDDGEELKNIFLDIGDWNIYFRSLEGRKEQIGFQTHNKFIFQFLKDNNYNNKHFNQDKILSLIPDNLLFYFYRGYFDGDGNIFSNNKQNSISITSCYEQDWHSIIKIFETLKINYNITRLKYYNKKNKLNSLSRIVCQNMDGISKFFKYIYPYEFDIGLKRKYDIFSNIELKIHNRDINKLRNKCPKCNSHNIIGGGKYKQNKYRFKCKSCNKTFIGIDYRENHYSQTN